MARDALVLGALANEGIRFLSFKDHVIFEREEVLTLANKPYGVFTPYKNAWLEKTDGLPPQTLPNPGLRSGPDRCACQLCPSRPQLG